VIAGKPVTALIGLSRREKSFHIDFLAQPLS
jgi:hypothetical protein